MLFKRNIPWISYLFLIVFLSFRRTREQRVPTLHRDVRCVCALCLTLGTRADHMLTSVCVFAQPLEREEGVEEEPEEGEQLALEPTAARPTREPRRDGASRTLGRWRSLSDGRQMVPDGGLAAARR